MRDYLTLQLKPSKQLKADEIYQHFRTYFYGVEGSNPVEDTLAELKRFGTYYVAFSLVQEENPALRVAFRRLRLLVEVASPLVLKLYDCYSRAKTLPVRDFVTAVELLESYVFRRSACAMQTRSLAQIFASLAYRIKEDAPLVSLKVALHRQGKKRHFPSDVEFREAPETRDVYDMRNCHYLLDRLENESKEKIDTERFTIEHVMPQNESLSAEWQAMLGEDWQNVQQLWLHRLGNITLTGYNAEYSDRSFADKKTIAGGFNDSPLRLNGLIRKQDRWTATEMDERGRQLAKKAVTIWPALTVDAETVREAELEERKTQAARYRVDDLEFDPDSRALFDAFRPQIMALGNDIVEFCGAKTVTYRVYDFLLEIIPRKRRLMLSFNLDYENCDDPSQRASDATERAFVIHATESGGVLFDLRDSSQFGAAIHIARQANEKVSE